MNNKINQKYNFNTTSVHNVFVNGADNFTKLLNDELDNIVKKLQEEQPVLTNEEKEMRRLREEEEMEKAFDADPYLKNYSTIANFLRSQHNPELNNWGQAEVRTYVFSRLLLDEHTGKQTYVFGKHLSARVINEKEVQQLWKYVMSEDFTPQMGKDWWEAEMRLPESKNEDPLMFYYKKFLNECVSQNDASLRQEKFETEETEREFNVLQKAQELMIQGLNHLFHGASH